MTTPTSAAAVANAFLDIQDSDTGVFPRIDPMKLQKLVFYAHAWWLAFKDDALFDEDVCAWPWGPVVPAVYSEFRSFGANPIVGARAHQIVRIGPGPMAFRYAVPEHPNDEIMAFLRGVWESHKQYNGIQLSNATHSAGEPWTIVKEQYGDLSPKPVIPNDLIREVFKAKIAKQ